jgi:integrase/recombinase XerD
MLSYYIRDPKRLSAMNQNLLSEFLNNAAGYYQQQRHFYKYARAAIGYAAEFGDWLRQQRVKIELISDDHVRTFLDSIDAGMDCRRRKRAYSAVHVILRFIRIRYSPLVSLCDAEREVARLGEFLKSERGLAAGTIDARKRDLLRFLKHTFGTRRIALTSLSPECIHDYVASLEFSSQQRNVCTALRTYFRFKQMQGISTARLQKCLPTVRHSRTSLSPKWLDADEAERLLESIDRTSGTGKRNYAVILCMMDLGMRVGDVARLTLDDIDWTNATIQVSNHKRGRPYLLPLPSRVGRAIADYLSDGRPESQRRELFLRHAIPRELPTTAPALKRMVSLAWRRSGMNESKSGTHILRHTVATRMKHEGIGLKSIADVLGHSSLQTTTLYAQVDLPALRTVAAEWPEVKV